MTNSNERAVKVGDVVAWADVPDGALVREDGPSWPWGFYKERVTIVALGLTGQESADDLRRLAEMFEVREALTAGPALGAGFCRVYLGSDDGTGDNLIGGFSGSFEAARSVWAKRLHAAGWRPGMTAEDAARMLAEADR